MQQFRLGNEFEPGGFDEQAQREIIALAANIQRQEGNRASLSDLERAALEAGIEPRFVREAVLRRSNGELPNQHSTRAVSGNSAWSWHAIGVSAIFVPLQIYVVEALFTFDSHRGNWMPIALVIAAMFGLALPRKAAARRIAGALPILVAFFTMTVAQATYPFRGYRHGFWIPMLWIAALQAAVAVTIHLIKNRPAPEATPAHW